MSFGERLAELRKDKGLKQWQLAEILEINKNVLSKYERGIHETPDEIKIKIAKHFHISLDYLIGVIDEQIPYDRKDAIILPVDFPLDSIPKVKECIRLLYNDSKREQ